MSGERHPREFRWQEAGQEYVPDWRPPPGLLPDDLGSLDEFGYTVHVRCSRCLMRFGEPTTWGQLVWFRGTGWVWGSLKRRRVGNQPRRNWILPEGRSAPNGWGGNLRPCRRCAAQPRVSFKTLVTEAERCRAAGAHVFFV